MLDVLVDPIVYVEASGLVRFANSAAVELLGDTLIGETPDIWTAQLPADFLGGAGTIDTLRGALVSGRSVRSRPVRFVDPSGHPREVLASIVPVVHGDTIQGAVIYMHDITQERSLAAELLRTNQELHRRFDELVLQQETLTTQANEVAQQRALLAERNAELAQADRLKTQFLATMSHELRTPLNAVIGFAEVLLAADDPGLLDEHRPMVADIRTAGEQLLLLINDVLDLTRIEAGRLQVRIDRVDLYVPVAQAIDLTQAVAAERGVQVVNTLTPGAFTVLADPDRVRQVLLNLLSNALKFTSSGGVVSLSVLIEEGNGRVLVRDNGIGIAHDDIGRLFQPFVQIDSRLSRPHAGSGLGLAISKQLVEAMHGSIRCESVHGQGSTFSFTLPLLESRAPTSIVTVRPVARLTRSTHPALHVLIVDDNPLNRRVLRAMLLPLGCEVTEAEDGFAAIALATDIRPNLILMDLQMPGMDGLAATRALRANLATQGIPVVAVTAHAMPGDAQRALEAGCVGNLAKPVGRDRLMAAIDAAMGSEAWRR